MAETRIKGAFAGVIIGLLMIPGSVALHAWNEYRTIHRTHGLNEAESDVVTVDSERVATDQNGKLVHLAGRSHTDEVLQDKEFGIRENAVHLRRTVQMYQWTEDEDDDDGRKTYSYDLDWVEGRVRSESFNQRAGHENPQPKFKSRSDSAKNVTLGAYRLNESLRDQMQNWTPVEFGESSLKESRPDDSEQFILEGNQFYWSVENPNPDNPKVGDQKIIFEHVVADEVSFVAKLKGESFETYRTSNGETIERLYDGLLSSAEIFTKLRTENTMIAWAIRVGGTFLSVLGVLLLFGPIQRLFSWIPFLGNVAGNLFFMAALLIGCSISFLTISISWIAVRPLLGFVLLVASVGSIYLFARLGKKSSPAMQAEAADVTVVTDDMLVK